MIDHLYMPDLTQPHTLTLEFATMVQAAYWGVEMRTSVRYKPKFSYGYTLNTTGKQNVLKRRFEAEKELYNNVRLPVFCYPCQVNAISANVIDLLTSPVNLFNQWIYVNGVFYSILTAYNENVANKYYIGLQDEVLTPGPLTIYPVLIAKRDERSAVIEDMATWTRREQIEWQSL